ncbi:putative 28S rRNA (cytosine-C(5))-methyltransferase, partial [Perkinsus olseni]
EDAINKLAAIGIKAKADELIPDVIKVDPSNSKALVESSLVKDFTLVLQDRGSCLSAHSLLAGVQPGENITVVDACASPGSKTIHVLQLMRYRKIEGTMVAMELDPKRAKVLLDRLAKAGFLPDDGKASGEVVRLSAAHSPGISVEVRIGDFIKYSSPEVTHVNLDPSCSGSGLVDVHADSESVGAQRLRKLSSFQCRMLDHALTAFPAVRTVCYSTCSIRNEENGEVVKKALNRVQSGYRREWPFVVGSCWKEPTHGARDVQVRPEVDRCRGFYLCKLVKDAGVKRRRSSDDVSGAVEKSVTAAPPSRVNAKKHKRSSKAKGITITKAAAVRIFIVLSVIGVVGCFAALSHRVNGASLKQVQTETASVEAVLEDLRRDAKQLDANLRTIHDDLKKAVDAQRDDRNQVMSLTKSLGGVDLVQLSRRLTSLQEEATQKFAALEQEIARTREQGSSFVNEVSNGKVDLMRLVEDRNELESRLAATERTLTERLTPAGRTSCSDQSLEMHS